MYLSSCLSKGQFESPELFLWWEHVKFGNPHEIFLDRRQKEINLKNDRLGQKTLGKESLW